MTTTLVLVDDHRLFRQGLAALLSEQPEWRVVGEASDGDEAVRMVKRLRPDIVVLDVEMPGMNGVDVAASVRQQAPESKIVALSMYGDIYYQQRMFDAGASAYVLKNEASEDLVEAMQQVMRGVRYVSPLARLQETTEVRKSVLEKKEVLSKRELEVLRHLAEGRRNREIAEILNISEKTIETYRGRIMLKLNIDNIPDLVKFAIRAGITSTK